MVDLGSLVLLMSIFGAKVAILYVVLGLVIAVAGGTLIEKLHMENQVEEFIRRASAAVSYTHLVWQRLQRAERPHRPEGPLRASGGRAQGPGA